MRVTVEEVTKKAGKNGEYLSIKADGKYYSCFKDSVFPLFQPKAVLEVEIEEKGKYKNIVDAKAVSGDQPSNGNGSSKGNRGGYGCESEQKSREIARMNALTNATNLLQGREIADEKLVTYVTCLAEKLYRWIKEQPQC